MRRGAENLPPQATKKREIAMQTEKLNRRDGWLWYLVPVLGTVFYIWYILAATEDVVYTDYIRLINSYLPDVWDPKKFFVADIFTRMPVNYLERIINVVFFRYSTTFEMVLGALCTGAAALVLSAYCRRRRIGIFWYAVLMAVFFSLNKWEMITNGTGWCHFLAFAGFYLHFFLWDRVWERQNGAGLLQEETARQDTRDRRMLKILPWLLILGTGGAYGAAYAAILILTYGFCFVLDKKRKGRPDYRHLVYGAHVLVPMLLYLISNAFAETEYAGTTGRSIAQVLADNWILFPKFLVKSLATLVIGDEPLTELLTNLDRGMALCYLLGILVFAGYLLALRAQFSRRLYQTSIFPLMLIFWGGCNHLLVLAARWIFENSDYGMSSRYALQYQAGILGIILTFGLLRRAGKKAAKTDARAGRKEAALRVMAAAFALIILAGNLYTTAMEIKKAPNRKAYARSVREIALHYREASDDELETWMQYRHGPERIRSALAILEEQKWNIFGGED